MLLWTVMTVVYLGIALISMWMTLKEHQASGSRDLIGLSLGSCACLVWPVAALFVLILVNVTAKPVHPGQPDGMTAG